jgi:FkbM family methyltransferase
MSVTHRLRKLLWKLGYDVQAYSPRTNPLARRKKLLESYDIDVVLDIGANTGQFARQIRGDLNYLHRIISFEPLSSAYRQLEAHAAADPLWSTHNFALGDAVGKCRINISGNSYSSSLLNMLSAHARAAPESMYSGDEEIEVRTLDSVFDGLCPEKKNIYLKMDTQGFESRVIRGAEKSLAHINTVQMEMSLVPLYEGELLFNDLYQLMIEKGYVLVSIEPGFSDPATGQLLQVDGTFHRFLESE